jgi:hypothetical protein
MAAVFKKILRSMKNSSHKSSAGIDARLKTSADKES